MVLFLDNQHYTNNLLFCSHPIYNAVMIHRFLVIQHIVAFLRTRTPVVYHEERVARRGYFLVNHPEVLGEAPIYSV